MIVGATGLQRDAFRALGVDVELLLDAPADVAAAGFAAARGRLADLERRLSRFLPDSALSRLNRLGRIDGEPELAQVVALALAARERTGGRFDPTVHDALLACGYDRSFEQVRDDDRAPGTAPCGGAVEVDEVAGRVALAPGVGVDLGGIAKGFAVDRVADLLGSLGPCLVNAGGDVAVRGALDGGSWPVGVETSEGERTLALPWGGLATSGRDVRRWRRGGVEAHHLIDPRTGAPSRSDLLRVTAAGASAAAAEVSAKALFLAGAAAAQVEADALAIPCLLVTASGSTIAAGGLA